MTLHSHLRMDGAWRVYATGEPWRGRPAHVIRVVLRTLTTVAVGYHLHDLSSCRPRTRRPSSATSARTCSARRTSRAAGTPDEAVRRLRRPPRPHDRRGPARPAQPGRHRQPLQGRGALPARHPPAAPVSKWTTWRAWWTLAHRLLLANRGRWTQATTGSLRRGEESYVYGRGGAPCRRCGTLIERETLGERVTFWCPIVPARPGADHSPPRPPPRPDPRPSRWSAGETEFPTSPGGLDTLRTWACAERVRPVPAPCPGPSRARGRRRRR